MREDEVMTESGSIRDSAMDTIVAISTAPGLGAVALVRVSGPEAWEIVRRLTISGRKYS